MKMHLPGKKSVWFILGVTVPVIFWSLSEILPIMASGLNRKGYQSVKKNPSEASSLLIIRNKDSIERKSVKDIIFPLSRKSDPRFDHDRFELRIFGLLDLEKPGFYGIGTESDDGSWIWIDGKMIVDNGGLHSRQERMELIHLQKGLHLIELKFENLMGGAYLDTFWIPPNGTRQPLSFYPHPFGRIASALFQTAYLFFKIAQYWTFFLIPFLLYRILFPSKVQDSRKDDRKSRRIME
jgi:hypothetical protein